MSRKITKKQKQFADKYMETGNGTQSALATYDTTDLNTAAAISSENLTKPKVIEYLQSKAERASEIIFEIAEEGESDNVRLGASKDILDRAGFKPTEKTLNINANIELAPSDRLKKIADKLNAS